MNQSSRSVGPWVRYSVAQRSDSAWIVLKTSRVLLEPAKTITVSGPFHHKSAAEGERDALERGGE